MAFSWTAIGTATNPLSTRNLAMNITVPGGGVPAGATIYVATREQSSISLPSAAYVTDDAANTYVLAKEVNPNGQRAQGVVGLYYAKNAKALSAGQKITYTFNNAKDAAAATAFYVTGPDQAAPLDGVAVSASGSSTVPSVTSSVPIATGDIFVGVVGIDGSNSFTQAGGWSTPSPEAASCNTATDVKVDVGVFVASDNAAHAYSPTLGLSAQWGALIAQFRASGAAAGSLTGFFF